jgi:hypothetical protein
MFDVTVAMDVEGSPAGVRNPTVLLGEMAPKQKIMKRARKRDVDISPEVDMTDFRLTEAIFTRREPMGMHGNPGPGDNFLSESFGTRGQQPMPVASVRISGDRPEPSKPPSGAQRKRTITIDRESANRQRSGETP